MRRLSTLLITTAVLAVGGGSASAQTRDGIFVGAGAGWGSAKVEADEVDSPDRRGSWTLNLRVGRPLSERLLVGAELNGWFDSEDDDSVSLFNGSLAFYYYPTERPLFVKAGVGLARADFDIGDESVSGVGLGFMAGLGYDIPISGNTSLTPMVAFWLGKPGDLSVDDIEVLRGFKHNVIELGVAVTFY
jgi:hypothetical protein